jgi:hypothetical protein
MDPLEFIGGGIGLVIFIAVGLFLFVYAIITFLMPFFVYGILQEAKTTNARLAQLISLAEKANRHATADTEARSFQVENTFAVLKKIRDNSDTLLTHAQYQTEVTKHQLETRATTGQ